LLSDTHSHGNRKISDIVTDEIDIVQWSIVQWSGKASTVILAPAAASARGRLGPGDALVFVSWKDKRTASNVLFSDFRRFSFVLFASFVVNLVVRRR